MAVLVPVYWRNYGVTNFLYFCDVALFFTLAAVWTERPLWASMPAVGILLPQALWILDFLGQLVGHPLLGMTGYMFDAQIPYFTRGLSLFHFWLPLLIAWLVYRLGYDRRAFRYWTVLAVFLLFVCYFGLPAPPAPIDNPSLPVNVNYVYGFSDSAPQTQLSPNIYFGLIVLLLPILVYFPTHALLCWTTPQAAYPKRPVM